MTRRGLLDRLPKFALRVNEADAASDLSPGVHRQIRTIRSAQPESAAWLVLLEAVLREGQKPLWDEAAAGAQLPPQRISEAPLLTEASVPLAQAGAEDWVGRILLLASQAGPDATSLARAATAPNLDARGLIEAAVNAEDARLATLASHLGLDAPPLAAVADLAAMPLLQALRRRFTPAVSNQWHEGYCPICGDWPHLAEVRGLERTRRLRCARCGGDWTQPGVRCPFCAAAGQGTRATLVSEQDGEARKVETCTHCHGYLKVVSTLRAWPGEEVCLADLATVDLDLAALERGYVRPDVLGGLQAHVR